MGVFVMGRKGKIMWECMQYNMKLHYFKGDNQTKEV